MTLELRHWIENGRIDQQTWPNDLARKVDLEADRLKARHPREIIESALKTYSPTIGIAFSGAEDVVLLDMAARVGLPYRVFCLDTGRLHPETYEFLDRIREHYQVTVEIFFPQPQAVERLVQEKGLFSFYRDGHAECCGIRKVEPLCRALSTLPAWITGQRHDQSPSTRDRVPVVQLDPTFASPQHLLVKFNPLANWSAARVWAYIREYEVPHNVLHTRGFASIGCQPCTRAVLPGQHEREGRWWWEDKTKKECGLHAGNLSSLNPLCLLSEDTTEQP